MNRSIVLLFSFYAIFQYLSAVAVPIRPLAQEHVVVGNAADYTPAPLGLYTPSIIRLPSGRLVATYEVSIQSIIDGRKRTQVKTQALVSDDQGKTWKKTREWNNVIQHSRLFLAGGKLYLFGHKGRLCIARSDDEGETWTEPFILSSSTGWHQSACNVWFANGNIYLAMERRTARGITSSWPVGDFSPILLRASVNDDLTVKGSWVQASKLSFSEIIPGYKENTPQIGFFGVPFFAQSYPAATRLAPSRNFHPMGWLETNVVQITDPKHYWYDPEGKTFHLFMRANVGRSNIAAMLKVVEHKDGSMTTQLESAPSGEKILFVPFPGGQMRFHVIYDKVTQLYWLLSSQTTDSMTRANLLPKDRVGIPTNERHRMVLHFSKNMIDWCFAGIVAIGESPKEARHYASMDIDGEDLVILSRSGDKNANSAHDGNLITFHRVKNFRELVY